MHMWQMKCTVSTLKTDVAIKIIIIKMLFGIQKYHVIKKINLLILTK